MTKLVLLQKCLFLRFIKFINIKIFIFITKYMIIIIYLLNDSSKLARYVQLYILLFDMNLKKEKKSVTFAFFLFFFIDEEQKNRS